MMRLLNLSAILGTVLAAVIVWKFILPSFGGKIPDWVWELAPYLIGGALLIGLVWAGGSDLIKPIIKWLPWIAIAVLAVLWLGFESIKDTGKVAGCALPGAGGPECTQVRVDRAVDKAAEEARVAAAVAEALLARPKGSQNGVIIPLCLADETDKAGWSERVINFSGWAVALSLRPQHVKRQHPTLTGWQTVLSNKAIPTSDVRYCTISTAIADTWRQLVWTRIRP